jgi:hypothetical protein
MALLHFDPIRGRVFAGQAREVSRGHISLIAAI